MSIASRGHRRIGGVEYLGDGRGRWSLSGGGRVAQVAEANIRGQAGPFQRLPAMRSSSRRYSTPLHATDGVRMQILVELAGLGDAYVGRRPVAELRLSRPKEGSR